MEEFFNLFCDLKTMMLVQWPHYCLALQDLHILCKIEAANVSGGDDPVACQLPDVKLVNCQDPVNLRHQFLLQGVDLDMCGNSLQQDEGGLDEERPDRLENEDDEEERETWVHIELVLPVSLPHYDGGDDDDYRA